jgi:hypothetical protein
MLLLKIKNSLFHRFGNRYGSLFDGNHFLGRNSFDDNWLTKDKPKAKRKLRKAKPEDK